MESLLPLDLVHCDQESDVFLVISVNYTLREVDLRPVNRDGKQLHNVPFSSIRKLSEEELLAPHNASELPAGTRGNTSSKSTD